MPSEAQLKNIMKAAIAKKKQAAAKERNDDTLTNTSPQKTSHDDDSSADLSAVASAKEEILVKEEVLTKEEPPITPPPKEEPAPPTKRRKKGATDALPSEVDWTRTFFGRPVRIAVYHKEIYYAVPDILAITNGPNEQTIHNEQIDNEDINKVIAPSVKAFLFPSPNGGSEPLDAATADDLITMMHRLEFKTSEPIEKWLTETTNAYMTIIG